MSSKKNLISLDYHNDDDTGMYKIGEIDFGVSSELDSYLKQYGRKGMDDILKTMSHLIWHIQEYGYKTIKENEKDDNHESACAS